MLYFLRYGFTIESEVKMKKLFSRKSILGPGDAV